MDKLNEKAKAQYHNFIRAAKLKETRQRDEIVELFLKTEKHLTADELFDRLRKKHPGTGFATVYRTLRRLVEAGLAAEIKIGSGKTRYEHKFGHAHHDHLICTACGKFIEIHSDAIERLQEKAAKEHGFLPQRHRLEIFGFCRECGKGRAG